MTIGKYLNPRNDVAFKKIFGSEKNKDILKHFLNDVLTCKDKSPIKEVTIINPQQLPEIAYKKESTLDVLCEDETGIKYIVEMQVAKRAGFEKRAQYYAAKTYSSQIRQGDNYNQLKEVIFLAITEYIMFPDKKKYKSEHVTLDKETLERDLKDFSFTFVELPKFNITDISKLKTYEQKWCYFFKHAHEPDNMVKAINDSSEVIRRAYQELEAHNWTEKELVAYEASEKFTLDLKAREKYIQEEAYAEGKEKGIEQERVNIVKNMLESHISIDIISTATKLSVAEIEKLKKDFN